MRTLLSILAFTLSATIGLCQSSPGIRGFKRLRIGSSSTVFSPTNFPNLFGWWKADGMTNLVDGSAGVYALDYSGHNLHMQPADANAPYWTNNFQNGKAALFFDGVNDYMTNAAEMAQTNVIFVVISHRIPNQARTHLFEARDTDGISQLSSQSFAWINSEFTNAVGYAGGGMTVTNSLTNTVTTFVVQYAASAGRMWTNGVAAINEQASGTGGMLMGMNVGQGGPLHTGAFFKGYLLEMFCLTNTYASQGTVLQDGCNYLRAKYGHY